MYCALSCNIAITAKKSEPLKKKKEHLEQHINLCSLDLFFFTGTYLTLQSFYLTSARWRHIAFKAESCKALPVRQVFAQLTKAVK